MPLSVYEMTPEKATLGTSFGTINFKEDVKKTIHNLPVGDLNLPLWKNMISSVGIITITLWWTNIAMERSTIFNGKIHYKWPFSIAMLVHQRVCPNRWKMFQTTNQPMGFLVLNHH